MGPPTIDEYQSRLAAYVRQRGGSGKCIDGSAITADLRPTLSVITTAWNSAQTVGDTIHSVLAQAFRNIEYVVIDGGSTDGTVDTIRRHEAQIAYWHSGKDLGISDAFNLGIAASHGRYVAIVNSDDWMTRDQAQIAVLALDKSQAAFCFGDAQIYDVDGKLRYRVAGDPKYFLCDWCRMPDINHPSVVVRRESYAAVGLFDTQLKIAMDFDWHLRAELGGLRGVYAPELCANMRLGGVCDAGWKRGLREVRTSAIKHGISPRLANRVYRARVMRAHTRLLLHRFVPTKWVNNLHSLINPRYTPESK